MSDEEATKKTEEEVEAKKKIEEAQKRLWVIQLVRDPEGGGATIVQPIQNVQKQWQLDMMLAQATGQQELTKQSRSIIELLKNMGVLKEPKKGIFKR